MRLPEFEVFVVSPLVPEQTNLLSVFPLKGTTFTEANLPSCLCKFVKTLLTCQQALNFVSLKQLQSVVEMN